MQEDEGLGGVFLAHVGGRAAEDSGQIDCKMADGRQSVGRAAGAGAAVIFAQLGIEDVKAAFDEPAAAKVLQQERGVSPLAREAGDRIGRRRAGLALHDGAAFEADNLLRTSEAPVYGPRGGSEVGLLGQDDSQECRNLAGACRKVAGRSHLPWDS